MDEKVSKGPMIALLAAAAGGLLIFSIAQFSEKKASQQTAVNELAAEHAETAAVMKKIGADAARNEGMRIDADGRASTTSIELQRLDEADEREWRAKHNLPPQPPPSPSAAR